MSMFCSPSGTLFRRIDIQLLLLATVAVLVEVITSRVNIPLCSTV